MNASEYMIYVINVRIDKSANPLVEIQTTLQMTDALAAYTQASRTAMATLPVSMIKEFDGTLSSLGLISSLAMMEAKTLAYSIDKKVKDAGYAPFVLKSNALVRQLADAISARCLLLVQGEQDSSVVNDAILTTLEESTHFREQQSLMNKKMYQNNRTRDMLPVYEEEVGNIARMEPRTRNW